MATYFVSSAGNNSTGTSWANAFTSLAGAIAAATADGDIIVIDRAAIPAGDSEVAADTVITALAHISIISAINDGGSAWTAAAMSFATQWLGNSTLNRSYSFGGGKEVLLFGLCIRTAGTTADNIRIGTSDGSAYTLESCYLWAGNTQAGADLTIGGASAVTSKVTLRNCTLRFGNVGQTITVTASSLTMEGCSVSSDGSAITQLLDFSSATSSRVDIIGCTFLAMGSSATMVANATATTCAMVVFSQSMFPANGYTVLTPSSIGFAGLEVYVHDCASGDHQLTFEYHNSRGSLVCNDESGVPVFTGTPGNAARSWVITTTAACSKFRPFITPWISVYNTTLTALTLSGEIMQDVNTTALKNNEVWIDIASKQTAGYAHATFDTSRASLSAAGSNIAAGAGLASWTNYVDPAWSGKCELGYSITPAEVGDISMRYGVGLASYTLFVNPEIGGV